jgi:hypothetical protein
VGIPRTQIFRDLGPAVLASAPLLLVAMLVRRGLDGQVPVLIVLIAAGAAGGVVYLTALRVLSKEAWNDVVLLVNRVLPVERLRRRLSPVRMLRRSRQVSASPGSTANEVDRSAIKGAAEVQSGRA